MRKITLFLVLLFLLNLIACKDEDIQNDSYFIRDENDNSVLVSDRGNTVFANETPVDIPYNESKFTLLDVDFYEHYYSGYYQYALIAIVTFSMNELPESELHWLTKEDLEIDVYLTCEDNLYDFDALDFVGCCDYENGIYKYIYCTPFGDGSRYSFVGSKVSTVIDAKQKATYESVNSNGEMSKYRKHESLHFSDVVPDDVPGMEEMPTLTQRYFGVWITNKALGLDK